MQPFHGIDVSKYQGRINWSRVKADGVTFAMVRAGIAQGSGQLKVDPCLRRNLKEAADAGIETGIYVYLKVESEEAAAEAARQAIALTEGYTVTYPVACDFEDRLYFSKSREQNTALVKAFMNEVEKEEFYPILYTYTAFAGEFLDMEQLTAFDLWIADYRGQVGYPGKYTMWQYSDKGQLDGIAVLTDLDLSYLDYPTVIRAQGKNRLPPLKESQWQILIYSFKKKSRASEVAEAFRALNLYCEPIPWDEEWAILMYSFREEQRALEVSRAIRTLGYYNEVQPREER